MVKVQTKLSAEVEEIIPTALLHPSAGDSHPWSRDEPLSRAQPPHCSLLMGMAPQEDPGQSCQWSLGGSFHFSDSVLDLTHTEALTDLLILLVLFYPRFAIYIHKVPGGLLLFPYNLYV